MNPTAASRWFLTRRWTTMRTRPDGSATVRLRTTRKLRHGRYQVSVTLSTRRRNAAKTVSVKVR